VLFATAQRKEGTKILIIGLNDNDLGYLALDNSIMKSLEGEDIGELSGWEIVVLGPEATKHFDEEYDIPHKDVE
jgi:hypothetical protein